MADVFISYSRRDAAFAQRVAAGLSEQGRDVFIDLAGIADGEVFPDALREAIHAASCFVFVISPQSAASAYCREEVEIALRAGKRIVPLEHRPVADAALPEAVRVRSWVPFGDDGDFESSLARLGAALDLDIEVARGHARWLTKAVAWAGADEGRDFLLRGRELAAAEAWMASAEGGDPSPTELQRRYVARSRIAAGRRQRAMSAGSLSVAVVAVVLVGFALVSREQAQAARSLERSRQLAQVADAQDARDPELAVVLARQALAHGADQRGAVGDARRLGCVALLGHLDPTGPQGCGKAAGLSFSPDVAFAPDDRSLAQASCDGRLRIVSATTGSPLRSVRIARRALCVAYSPGGRMIAVGTEDGVRLIDARTLAPQRTLPGGGGQEFVSFSPDGRWLAAGGARGAWVWELASGHFRRLATPGGLATSGVVFLAGGHRVLVGLSGLPHDPGHGLASFDLRSGRQIGTALPGRSATAIAARPGGHEVAAAALDVTALQRGARAVTVERLTLPALRRLKTVFGSDEEGVGDLAWSPDGARLAVARGGTGVDILGDRGEAEVHLRGGSGTSSVVFNRDGTRVASYDVTGHAAIWRAAEPGRPLTRLHGAGAVGQLAAAGGRLWVSTASGAVAGIDVRTGAVTRRLRFASPRGLDTAPQLGVDGRAASPFSAAGRGGLFMRCRPGAGCWPSGIPLPLTPRWPRRTCLA